MNSCARWGALLVTILGIAGLVFGIMFVIQAGSAEQDIAAEIAPLTLDEVDATYEAVKANQEMLAAVEEPNIQAGLAEPSATYNYLTVRRTSLGAVRSNIGMAGFVRISGIMSIVMGAGLVVTGAVLMKKD